MELLYDRETCSRLPHKHSVQFKLETSKGGRKEVELHAVPPPKPHFLATSIIPSNQ